MRRMTTRPLAGILAGALLAMAPATARAQADFLFDRPAVSLSLFGGLSLPGEGSDLFDFVREQVTLEEGDFAAPAVLAEVALRATERLDLVVGVEHASRTRASEMRDWVTMDDLPIPQTNQFTRTGLHVGAKAYLLPRGRAISRFSWVPNRWSPYLGGGVGVTRYEFVQEGDFVDYQTLDIFESRIASSGHGMTTHALAGVQLSITPRFLLRGEYRYTWGAGQASRSDFSADFGDMDLSGSGVLIGAAMRL